MVGSLPAIDLDAALDAIPDEVALLDASGHIRYTNRAWGRFARDNGLKGDPQSIGEDYIATIQADPDAEGVADSLRDVLDGSSEGFRWEYPCHSPTQQHWFEMKVGALPEGGAVVVHTDVTDRILSESASRRLWFEERSRQQVHKTNHRLQRLLNTVSHEIATPLTPLALQLAACRRAAQDTPSEVPERLDKIEDLVHRLSNALEHLRDRLHALHEPSHDADATADLGSVVARSRSAWESTARKRSIQLHVDLDHVRLAVDTPTLRFVLESLVGEAMHLTGAGQEVRLHSVVEDGVCHIEATTGGATWDLTDPDTLDNALEHFDSHLDLHGSVASFALAVIGDGKGSPDTSSD